MKSSVQLKKWLRYAGRILYLQTFRLSLYKSDSKVETRQAEDTLDLRDLARVGAGFYDERRNSVTGGNANEEDSGSGRRDERDNACAFFVVTRETEERGRGKVWNLRAGDQVERDMWLHQLESFVRDKAVVSELTCDAVMVLTGHLLEHGLSTRALFRNVPAAVDVDELLEKLLVALARQRFGGEEEEVTVGGLGYDEADDATSCKVASLLVQLLRDAPETIFTSALFDKFVPELELDYPTASDLRSLCQRLPETNRKVLQHVAHVLDAVCKAHAQTAETVATLGDVVGPAMFRKDGGVAVLPGASPLAASVQHLISELVHNRDEIFAESKTRRTREKEEVEEVEDDKDGEEEAVGEQEAVEEAVEEQEQEEEEEVLESPSDDSGEDENKQEEVEEEEEENERLAELQRELEAVKRERDELQSAVQAQQQQPDEEESHSTRTVSHKHVHKIVDRELDLWTQKERERQAAHRAAIEEWMRRDWLSERHSRGSQPQVLADYRRDPQPIERVPRAGAYGVGGPSMWSVRSRAMPRSEEDGFEAIVRETVGRQKVLDEQALTIEARAAEEDSGDEEMDYLSKVLAVAPPGDLEEQTKVAVVPRSDLVSKLEQRLTASRHPDRELLDTSRFWEQRRQFWVRNLPNVHRRG